MNAHVFAIHLPNNSFRQNNHQLAITEPSIVHRLNHVLRLKINEPIIAFSPSTEYHGALVNLTEKTCVIDVLKTNTITPSTPAVHWFLPVLQREALEECFYNLTVLGVTKITPFTSTKTKRSWGATKDYERVQRICIAAAEQSKQFYLPAIDPITSFEKIAQNKPYSDIAIFLDPAGTPLPQVLAQHTPAPQSITLLAGPEGDLTTQEKLLLDQAVWRTCKLTKSILTAEHAIALASGIVGCLF